jgi:hypothetical protein
VDRTLKDLTSFLSARTRVLATLVAATLVFNALAGVSRALEPGPERASFATDNNLPEGAEVLPDGRIRLKDGTIVSQKQARKLIDSGLATPTKIPTITKSKAPTHIAQKVLGVTDTEIKIVYYWKEERTKASPALSGTAAEGANLDEALAFREYVKFINKHANDGTTFMGVPINLHGRKLVGEVVEVGSGDFSYAQNAERIAVEKKPFAAIASHGGISAYICPRLAQAGIFNLSTYDVGGKGGTLIDRTNGYCVGAGLSWERQVDVTMDYLKVHKSTTYGLTGDKRVYGVIYSEYPGMDYAAPKMIDKLRAAGIPIPADGVAKIPADLATSQTQARLIIDKMRKAGVNTLIMPEGNSPLNFTHASQANGWDPDYYVWPCSGQDSSGMVRLFNAAQWEGAEGLSCYDPHWDSDAANDDTSRRTEWFKQYQEMHGTGSEPPAPAPLVYSSMAQLLAGITFAGRDLNPLNFNRGLDLVKDFRYDAIAGKTTDPRYVMLRIGTPDRSFIGDVGHVRWSGSTQRAGGLAGKYLFLEDRRLR